MFREIKLSDKAWMDQCRAHGLQEMTVVSFPAVYTWQSTFGLTIDGDSRFYVVRSEEDKGYYYPVGDSDVCRAYVLSLLKSFRRQNCFSGQYKVPGIYADHSLRTGTSFNNLKLVYVPKQELGWLKELGFTIKYEPDTSEYIYSSRSLAFLDSGSGTNYRVKIRHFSRDNIWQSKPLVFPGSEALLKEKTAALESIISHSSGEDILALLCASENPAEIGLSGVYIETSTHDWAFLLGYPSNRRIYDMSFVKYSPGISRNAVPVCISETAKLVYQTWPLINLEDDLGVEGIRKMKRLYHPLCQLDSYTAVFEPKGE